MTKSIPSNNHIIKRVTGSPGDLRNDRPAPAGLLGIPDNRPKEHVSTRRESR
ncbi:MULTISPECIES: hypothetical protein [Thalassospira]|uniref:hypothetical protein n=1 Tax=Thalassospira TaxID=168934 RepID=UPI0008275DDD|nr:MULTISPECIES: hypothetical protein [Thalassospira]OCK10298.1 hypothetical protein KO164_0003 [Thalassospira sp. KO164]SEC84701.1 hypothetical protein SAMN04515623_0003 [Thalassospira permensis]